MVIDGLKVALDVGVDARQVTGRCQPCGCFGAQTFEIQPQRADFKISATVEHRTNR